MWNIYMIDRSGTILASGSAAKRATGMSTTGRDNIRRDVRWIAAATAILLGNILVYMRYPGRILKFYRRLGYLPNVCDPKSKNEKFLWRKTFDRNPMYRILADKLTVREFIMMRCPELAMSEIVWIGSSPQQIPQALLQPGIVVKTNNGCNRNIFISQVPVDRVQFNKQIAQWLARPYGVTAGEWAYRRIQPSVFIEKMIALPSGREFFDLCFHVLMGKCLLATVDKDVKQESERIAVFDPDGNRLPAHFKDNAKSRPCKELPEDFQLPATFGDAVRYAEEIARDFDYVRVDFMSHGNRLYFCECTIFPMGGYSIISGGADERIAAAWDLQNSWFMQSRQTGIRGIYADLYRYRLSE